MTDKNALTEAAWRAYWGYENMPNVLMDEEGERRANAAVLAVLEEVYGATPTEIFELLHCYRWIAQHGGKPNVTEKGESE